MYVKTAVVSAVCKDLWQKRIAGENVGSGGSIRCGETGRGH